MSVFCVAMFHMFHYSWCTYSKPSVSVHSSSFIFINLCELERMVVQKRFTIRAVNCVYGEDGSTIVGFETDVWLTAEADH